MASALCRLVPLGAGLRVGSKPAAAMASRRFVWGAAGMNQHVPGTLKLPQYPCIEGVVTLPTLPYEYDALEPTISAKIMEIHHSKHHQTYVNGYNAAQEALAEAKKEGDNKKIKDQENLLKFHGGGHINHSLFWENLAPTGKGGGGEPTGKLAAAIDRDFGSFEKFKEHFVGFVSQMQGSAWAWLVKKKTDGKLIIVGRFNQNYVRLEHVHPLMCVDAWEHAYYLQYENRKVEYFNAIWDVINWETVAKRYEEDTLL